MRVKCKNTYPTEKDIFLLGQKFNRNRKFGVQIDQEYLVLAMSFIINGNGQGTGIWVQVLTDKKINHVSFCPISLFDVIDPRLSKYWKFEYKSNNSNNEASCNLYPESFYKQDYHEALFEGVPEIVRDFQKIHEKMRLEFPISSITERAVNLNKGNWVTSPDYEYSWEADPQDGMTKCPKTQKIFHNPLYF